MLAERGAAPAPVFRTHRSGRPRATVRSNYVGLPSMAGRGRTNAGGSPRDQGGEEPAVRPRKRGPEDTNRRGGAPEGERPLRRRARRCKALRYPRLSALRPLACRGERRKARPAPLNSPGPAQPCPKSRSRKILTAQASRQFDFNRCGRKTGARFLRRDAPSSSRSAPSSRENNASPCLSTFPPC